MERSFIGDVSDMAMVFIKIPLFDIISLYFFLSFSARIKSTGTLDLDLAVSRQGPTLGHHSDEVCALRA